MDDFIGPGGTLSFLFTDIEGSTRLWEHEPVAMASALARHHAILEAAIQAHRGVVFRTVGDAFCAYFVSAGDAVQAALAAQTEILAEAWPTSAPIRVRMAVHTGAPTRADGKSYDPILNRLARVLGTAHGGQFVVSQTTREVLDDDTLTASIIDLGVHPLRDLSRPERIFQVARGVMPVQFPPLRTLAVVSHNLPEQLTSFVGREEALAELGLRLRDSRLVSLIGAGGVGKTRLALHAAADVADAFPGGVWLVELGALREPGQVAPTVATTLAIPEDRSRLVEEVLIRALRDRPTLLVLDNCEHLIEVVAQLVDKLLRSCPLLTVVTTSREALGVPGEIRHRVASLPANDAASPSVRLFVDRASALRPDLVWTDEALDTAAQICARLDGIPLAIELAAARIKLLPLPEIARRLEARFDLLTGGSRTAMPRHQTLRAAIEWSVDLLSDSERTLLRKLGAFTGGCSIEAVEALGGSLDDLESLVDKSLVLPEDAAGESRFRLLETVRAYALEQLIASDEALAAREAHAAYFVDLAERAAGGYRGPEQARWLDRIATDHENLVAAIRETDAEQTALRIAGALQGYWMIRGHYAVGRTIVALALGKSLDRSPSPMLAKVWNAAGNLANLQGDYDAAMNAYQEALSLREALQDPQGIGMVLHNMGLIAFNRADHAAAEPSFRRAAQLLRENGAPWEYATAVHSLGMLSRAQGGLDEAEGLTREALAIRQKQEDVRGIALSLQALGEIALDRAESAIARTSLGQSLALCEELGDQQGIAELLTLLAIVHVAEGRLDRAAAELAKALTLHAELGYAIGGAKALEGIVVWAGAAERPEIGGQALGAAQALRSEKAIPRQPNEQKALEPAILRLKGATSPEALERAFLDGRDRGYDDAVRVLVQALERGGSERVE
ncbi:MAG TPA: tetratricopeptide repeat protein [Fimbriimonadaceae bacterium]|nr:tetratricopeptide repeat protein [Fimbriimonadaceae bacterium]